MFSYVFSIKLDDYFEVVLELGDGTFGKIQKGKNKTFPNSMNIECRTFFTKLNHVILLHCLVKCLYKESMKYAMKTRTTSLNGAYTLAYEVSILVALRGEYLHQINAQFSFD